MGLPQYAFGNGMRDHADSPLTMDDIANGNDISDRALFGSVWTPPRAPQFRRSHTDNGLRRDPAGNSDQDIFSGVFEPEQPTRPYAGPRSQWD